VNNSVKYCYTGFLIKGTGGQYRGQHIKNWQKAMEYLNAQQTLSKNEWITTLESELAVEDLA